MPWVPELFSAPALQDILDKRRRDALVAVPYFDGVLAGDVDALVESFVDEPEVHDPVRGRVRGEAAFRAFVGEASVWLRERRASVEDVQHVVLARHGFEEVVVHLGGGDDPIRLPVAILADRADDGRIEELRIYFDTRALTGRGTHRPPLLQPRPGLSLPEDVATHLRGADSPDVDVSPRGAFHEHVLEDAGVTLETCAVVDDGQGCAVEYNLARWGGTRVVPRAGVVAFRRGVRGASSRVRVYDDQEPPPALES